MRLLFSIASLLAAAALSLLTGQASGTDKESARPPNPPNSNAELHEASAPPALGDPTQPSPQLRELIDPAKVKGLDLPLIELKGRILGGRQPSAVILSIDKSYVVVRQGNEITLADPRAGTQTLRVVAISDLEVRLELLPFNRTLILR